MLLIFDIIDYLPALILVYSNSKSFTFDIALCLII